MQDQKLQQTGIERTFVLVEQFTYFRTEFCRKSYIKREIQRTLLMGNHCLCTFSSVLSSKAASGGLKRKDLQDHYKTCRNIS